MSIECLRLEILPQAMINLKIASRYHNSWEALGTEYLSTKT